MQALHRFVHHHAFVLAFCVVASATDTSAETRKDPIEVVMRCVDRSRWNAQECTLDSFVNTSLCRDLLLELRTFSAAARDVYREQLGYANANKVLHLVEKIARRGVANLPDEERAFMKRMLQEKPLIYSNLLDANYVASVMNIAVEQEDPGVFFSKVFSPGRVSYVVQTFPLDVKPGMSLPVRHLLQYLPVPDPAAGEVATLALRTTLLGEDCTGFKLAEARAYRAQSEVFYLRVMEEIKAKRALCGVYLN